MIRQNSSQSSIHSTLKSLHSRQVSSTSVNERRLVDQFYSSDNVQDIRTKVLHRSRDKSKDFLGLNLSKSSYTGFNDEEIINKINDIQADLNNKISSVINETQDKYELDFHEIKSLNKEIKYLSNKILNYISVINELINEIEIKFKAFLYEFLNNFLKYLKILDFLQQKLNESNTRLKSNKEILFKLNDKIKKIEDLKDKNLILLKQRNKWIIIILLILSTTFIIYLIIK